MHEGSREMKYHIILNHETCFKADYPILICRYWGMTFIIISNNKKKQHENRCYTWTYVKYNMYRCQDISRIAFRMFTTVIEHISMKI